MQPGEQIQDYIKVSDKLIKNCLITEEKTQPPVIQELVLARRHLEDANQRFKKAYNLLPDDKK
jgi:hypothetical protein